MRDALRVDEVGGPNWPAALSILLEGGYIVFQGVGLTLTDPSADGARTLGGLRARVFTEWQFQNLTDARALADLAHGQAVVEGLLEASAEVRDVAFKLGVRYELLDDYGMGAVLIGVMADGKVEWRSTPWQHKP